MQLKDVKVGQSYILNNRTFLRIQLDPAKIFHSRIYHHLICALDLSTYKVMCHNPNYEVTLIKEEV